VDLPAWVGEYIRRERLVTAGERVLVAVSGGPDSVALLHLLWGLREPLGLRLGVAHFHHGLRGEVAEAEARFVAELSARLELPCHLGRGETAAHARSRGLSLQMAARELRLAFFRETCQSHGYDKVAVGHTADDQVELFFLRLLRGAGLSGLKGMWPATPEGIIRPLLGVGKAVILAWLAREGLAYREDLSNLSPAFERNRVRRELLPYLRAHFQPRLLEVVWRLMARLQEDERYLKAETAAVWPRVVRQPAPELWALALPPFLALPGALQGRLLQQAVAAVGGGLLLGSQVDHLLALARARQSGGVILLPGCTAARAGGELHLFPPLPPPTAWHGLIPGPGVVETPPGWRWEAELAPAPPSAPPGPERVVLDPAQTSFPLEVRPPRPGDRFRPTGAPGVRKLQDFLTDSRLPRWLRPHLPLVLSQGRVVWVAGLRAAHPGAPAAGEVLTVTLSPISPLTRRLWDYIRAFGRRGPETGPRGGCEGGAGTRTFQPGEPKGV